MNDDDEVSNESEESNVPYFVTAEEYEEIFESNSTLSRHFRCASHTLNLLATTDFLKVLDKNRKVKTVHTKVMQKCEALWKNLRSVKVREILNNYLEVKLKQPVVTRWNASFDALKQIYSIKEKLLSSELKNKVNHYLKFNTEDFEYIQFYLTMMEPLANTLDRLQGETDAFYGILLPNLLLLKITWTNLIIELCDDYKRVVENLTNFLKQRFQNFFNVECNGEIATIAALSHPQFKASWIHCLDLEVQEKIPNLMKKSLLNEDKKESHDLLCNNLPNNIYNFGQPSYESSLLK